jgi:hypothetical protein
VADPATWQKAPIPLWDERGYARKKKKKNMQQTNEGTHDDLAGSPTTCTLNTANIPSDALMPSAATVQLWFIASLVLGRIPYTKLMSVWYV